MVHTIVAVVIGMMIWSWLSKPRLRNPEIDEVVNRMMAIGLRDMGDKDRVLADVELHYPGVSEMFAKACEEQDERVERNYQEWLAGEEK